MDTTSDLALAALIEGDATYTMIEVLKKDQPRSRAMLDVPLEKAKNLQTHSSMNARGTVRESPEGTAALGQT